MQRKSQVFRVVNGRRGKKKGSRGEGGKKKKKKITKPNKTNKKKRKMLPKFFQGIENFLCFQKRTVQAHCGCKELCKVHESIDRNGQLWTCFKQFPTAH